MFAAGAGYAEVCELLLSQTPAADVNKVVKATPEYIDQVAEAIAKGSEAVEPHKDGVTSLHVAALGGHLEVVKMLLEKGALPRVKDDEDQTPLLNAVSGNFGDVAFALVEGGADPNDVYVDEDQKAHNLLWDSIVVENTKFAALLVQKGADLSHRDEHNVTVLIQAAHKGQEDVVAALVERQSEIDVSAANDEGITALIAAASEGHHEIASTLITKTGLDVNVKDKDGTNALMAAAVRGHKEVVEVLLKYNANVNDQNVDGHTALMFAYNGRNQVASLLDKYSGQWRRCCRLAHMRLHHAHDFINKLMKRARARVYKDVYDTGRGIHFIYSYDFTRLHTTSHDFTRLHTTSHDFTRLYPTSHDFTRLQNNFYCISYTFTTAYK